MYAIKNKFTKYAHHHMNVALEQQNTRENWEVSSMEDCVHEGLRLLQFDCLMVWLDVLYFRH